MTSSPAVPGGGTYLRRLAERTRLVGSVLCLGIDPLPSALPPGFPPTVGGIERFARVLLDAALPYVAAVKANVAFFEAWGSAGIAALERLRSAVPSTVPLILDAKRADIGSTSEASAAALFDVLGADAVTLNPYLGRDAVSPYLSRVDRFSYLLCRTSNPGAAEFQDLVVAATHDAPEEPLYLRVARRISGWAPPGSVGLVAGATDPDGLARIRALAPEAPFLVPGVGAQGGSAETVLSAGRVTRGPAALLSGCGLLVAVSRGIAAAGLEAADPARAIAEAAAAWSARLPVLR